MGIIIGCLGKIGKRREEMPRIASRENTAIQLTPLSVRINNLSELLTKLLPIPKEWVAPGDVNSGKRLSAKLEPAVCNNYRQLVNSWKIALKWTPNLDCALSVMLASITSTRIVGDQLWVKVMGPAACGKSTLCEAVSVARRYIVAKSTIRGFHSGFKTSSDVREDNSLIAQLYNKTLVTKDGDTLLQSPNLRQILSEARDLYDSTSRTHYRNKMGRDYSGVRMTWLLCGTSSLRSIDSSELGERFLDCVIAERLDDGLEDEIGWRVANRAARSMSMEVDGKAETQYEPELAKAYALTGGYVEHLRENAVDLLSMVKTDPSALRYCMKLGKFVAYMRARPSKQQDEDVERELSFRLISQHVRLAHCLAVVLNRKEIDEEVMRRVRKVALDTARGKSLEIARVLFEAGLRGVDVRGIELRTESGMESIRRLVRFLYRIGVVERVPSPAKKRGSVRYRLTRTVWFLYRDVVKGTPNAEDTG